MDITDRFEADVVIMDTGLTGLSAAMSLAEKHPGISVIVLSKVHPLRSHSGAAQGGINAAVQILTWNAPDAIYSLDRWGANFSRNPGGTFAQRPFGGQRRNRTCCVADKTGHARLNALCGQCVKKGVRS